MHVEGGNVVGAENAANVAREHAGFRHFAGYLGKNELANDYSIKTG